MLNSRSKLGILSAVICSAPLLSACSGAAASSGSSAAPAKEEHVRGTIQTLNGDLITIATSTGNVVVQLGQSTTIGTVVASDRSHITDGSYLGITSVTQPDGSQRAVEVHVFPEDMRGSGEGSRPWDLPSAGDAGSRMTNGTASASKMTNGTVSESKMTNGTASKMTNGTASKMTNGTATGNAGETLTLRYKDGASGGSQTIAIPPGTPVVAIEPGRTTDLQPGVHVYVVAQKGSEGTLTAVRLLAGKNGVVPPM